MFTVIRASEDVKVFAVFSVESWMNFVVDQGSVLGIDQNIEHLFLAIFVRHDESVFGICDNLLGCVGRRIVRSYDASVFVIGVWGDEGTLFPLECVFG